MSTSSERESRTPSPKLDSFSKHPSNPPTPAPRVSLPVRFSNPENLSSKREVSEISADLLVRRSDLLLGSTDTLFQEVTHTLSDVDRVLLNISSSITENPLNQTIFEQNSSEFNMSDPILEFDGQSDTEATQNPTKTPDPLQSGHNYNRPPPTEKEMEEMRKYFAESFPERKEETIGLEAALRLLPQSFNGDKQEDTEVFLEKCEFAIQCASNSVQIKLLQGIIVRLTGKARQAVKFRTFNSWAELRDTLKAALEPQRTTAHLFLELYSSKQKPGEDVMAYATRVEHLQNIILEQQTNGKSMEASRALEDSLKAQTVQVFIEGLGPLKDFIKARNPQSLEKAIQAAREEDRVRKSSAESRKLYESSGKHTSTPGKIVCFSCNKTGHMSKDCRSTYDKSSTVILNKTSSNTATVRLICFYCKKEGHILKDCRKRQYVNSKKDQNPGNQPRPAVGGGRPVGEIKIAVSSNPSSSKLD